jgi:hypothetical protein
MRAGRADRSARCVVVVAARGSGSRTRAGSPDSDTQDWARVRQLAHCPGVRPRGCRAGRSAGRVENTKAGECWPTLTVGRKGSCVLPDTRFAARPRSAGPAGPMDLALAHRAASIGRYLHCAARGWTCAALGTGAEATDARQANWRSDAGGPAPGAPGAAAALGHARLGGLQRHVQHRLPRLASNGNRRRSRCGVCARCAGPATWAAQSQLGGQASDARSGPSQRSRPPARDPTEPPAAVAPRNGAAAG